MTTTAYINGEKTELSSGATIEKVLDQIGIVKPHRGIAVAVNAQVIPRREWTTFTLKDEAKIEIVTAIQGG